MRDEWYVGVATAGDRVHVAPVRGLVELRNWTLWRESARTEKSAQRIIARCQRLCDKMNAAQALAAKLQETLP